MTRMQVLLIAGAAGLAVASAAAAQPKPDTLPAGPFRSVHMMTVSPAQDAAVAAAVGDLNHSFQAQGCTGCAYHLFRLSPGQENKYNYLMIGDWPSGEAYRKVHASDDFKAANRKNPIMREVYKTELYGRYEAVR